jgi:hypothetical protein
MDVITQIRLLWLGGLGVLYGVALGAVWLLGGWQHRREQRRSRLLERVRRQFPVELRDQIALQVRGTIFGRRAVITVDMGNHAPEAWWSIVTGLSRNLSPDVRRLVCRTDARSFPVTLAITPGRSRGQLSCRLTATDYPSSGLWPSRACSARPARCRPPWRLRAWPIEWAIDIPSAFTGHPTGW